MKIKILSLLLCVGMICACNNTQKGAGIGAAGGAVLGAVIGHIAGNTAIGAAVGGAVGAGAGAIIGKKMDKAKAEAEAVKNAQVEEVKDANGLDAVKVTFDSGILFQTNKADLSTNAKNSLAQFAQVLRLRHCHYRPHRQHWFRCHQPAAVCQPRQQRQQLSEVLWCQRYSD